MKKFIIILGFVLIGATCCNGQVHLSHFFDLENEFQLENVDGYNRHWIGCLCGNTLSFCSNQVAREKKGGYVLNLHRMDVNNGKQEMVSIVLPDKKKAAIWEQKYWIYDIFEDSVGLLITTQKEIFDYRKTASGEFIYRQTVETEDADYTFRTNRKLLGVSQINDFGFVVKGLPQQRNRLDSLFAFPIPAAFLLQYGPNGYLKHYDDFFFFLPTPEPRIQVYNMDGELVSEIDFNFADWHPMPVDYVTEVSKLPYGPERAMHVFSTSTAYSFPMEIIPFSKQRLLLVSHQYDTEREVALLDLHLADINDGKIQSCIPVRTTFALDQVITDDQFPIYYNDMSLCLSVTENDRCVQIVRESGVEYRGKTGRDFKAESETYLQENEPVMKVRVMKLKNQ